MDVRIVGRGKSTLAGLLDMELSDRGYLSQVIDGDVVRSENFKLN